MFEKFGITNEELELLCNSFNQLFEESVKDGQLIKTEDEMFLAFAKLPINTSKIKSVVSKIRIKAVSLTAEIFNEILLYKLPEQNSDFVKQLHDVDEAAFIKILQLLKTELISLNIIKNNEDRKEIPITHVASLFNPEIKQYICLAAASTLSGIPNAANANIEMAFIKTFELFKVYEMTDKVLHLEGGVKRATDTSKKANKIRHAKTHMIEEFAIKLYKEGNFKSVRNASQQITKQVMDYAHNSEELKNINGTDKKFTNPFQAADTIERWIGRYEKKQKNN